MTVVRNEDGTYAVIDDNGSLLKGGFINEEDAWEWMDEQED